jgi:capsular polysaccharide export protein
LTLLEALPWIRSVWRKQWYRWTERGVQAQLTTLWEQRFFLVPLQVCNDAQVTVHADFDNIRHFIETTLRSFAQHAPVETILVFKHHPLARGYRDYSALIRQLAKETGISQRVRYIHDQHLPTLFDHARGVVVINSTVGFSALHHGVPTKVCGKSLFARKGLTYQGTLDEFWHAAPESRPDRDLYLRFRAHLVAETQLNGSFYKPLNLPGACAGLMWNAPSAKNRFRLILSEKILTPIRKKMVA